MGSHHCGPERLAKKTGVGVGCGQYPRPQGYPRLHPQPQGSLSLTRSPRGPLAGGQRTPIPTTHLALLQVTPPPPPPPGTHASS